MKPRLGLPSLIPTVGLLPMGLLVLFFASPCTLAGRESMNSTYQLDENKARIRRSSSELKKSDIEKCLLMYHNDADKRELFDIEVPESSKCVSQTSNCYRGICKKNACVCCPPITQDFIGKYNNKEVEFIEEENGKKEEIRVFIQPPLGRWSGEYCDKFAAEGEYKSVGDDDDDDDEDDGGNYEDPLKWQKFIITKDISKGVRPVPTKADTKERPDKCKFGTASCWRGTCIKNDECECFKYEDTVEEPGIYVGEYCDYFLEDKYYQFEEKVKYICSNSKDQPKTCFHGVCLPLQTTAPRCSCSRGYRGHMCDKKIKKCPPCLNKSRCKSKRTVLGKVKYCECKEGWAGYSCERPMVCLQPQTLQDMCITGTCRRKSKSGKKLQYCDCPSSQKLKTSGPFCKPHNYSPEKYGADAKCNKKWTCVKGFCKNSRCQCNDGYVSESDKEGLQCHITCTEHDKSDQKWGPGCENSCSTQNCLNDECLFDTGECAEYDKDGDKVFTECKAGFRRKSDDEFICVPQEPVAEGFVQQEVTISEVFAGKFKPEFELLAAPLLAEIKQKHQEIFQGRSLTGDNINLDTLHSFHMSVGSVVLDFTARFTTPDDSETDLQEFVSEVIKEQGEDFDGGLGEEYKLDVEKTRVGKPKLLSSGEKNDDKTTIGYGLVGVTFFFIMVCVFVAVKIKMGSKSRDKDKKDRKDAMKKKKSKSILGTDDDINKETTVKTQSFSRKFGSKASMASSTKSQTMKSKKIGKSVKSSQV